MCGQSLVMEQKTVQNHSKWTEEMFTFPHFFMYPWSLFPSICCSSVLVLMMTSPKTPCRSWIMSDSRQVQQHLHNLLSVGNDQQFGIKWILRSCQCLCRCTICPGEAHFSLTGLSFPECGASSCGRKSNCRRELTFKWRKQKAGLLIAKIKQYWVKRYSKMRAHFIDGQSSSKIVLKVKIHSLFFDVHIVFFTWFNYLIILFLTTNNYFYGH